MRGELGTDGDDVGEFELLELEARNPPFSFRLLTLVVLETSAEYGCTGTLL